VLIGAPVSILPRRRVLPFPEVCATGSHLPSNPSVTDQPCAARLRTAHVFAIREIVGLPRGLLVVPCCSAFVTINSLNKEKELPGLSDDDIETRITDNYQKCIYAIGQNEIALKPLR
jgi:hypothetical protein